MGWNPHGFNLRFPRHRFSHHQLLSISHEVIIIVGWYPLLTIGHINHYHFTWLTIMTLAVIRGPSFDFTGMLCRVAGCNRNGNGNSMKIVENSENSDEWWVNSAKIVTNDGGNHKWEAIRWIRLNAKMRSYHVELFIKWGTKCFVGCAPTPKWVWSKACWFLAIPNGYRRSSCLLQPLNLGILKNPYLHGDPNNLTT